MVFHATNCIKHDSVSVTTAKSFFIVSVKRRSFVFSVMVVGERFVIIPTEPFFQNGFRVPPG